MTVKTGSIKELTESVVLPEEVKQKIKKLDEILMGDPHNIPCLLQKAFLLYCNQSDGAAINILEAIIKYDNKCVDAYVWLAELYLYHWADAEQAQEVLKVPLSLGLVRADIYYLLACAYQKQQDVKSQLHNLKKSLTLEPSWILPRLNLIGVLIKQEEILSARQELLILNQYIQLAPNRQEMHNYYETFITGRHMSDFDQKLLQEYEEATK